MTDLKWVHSYETVKFDTEDGDLHKGQFAKYNGGHLIRVHPENNNQFVLAEKYYEGKDINIQDILSGLTEVSILAEENMYYDEFLLPNGRKFREKSTKQKYKDLSKPNAEKRTRKVTDSEINDIQKEDNQWL